MAEPIHVYSWSRTSVHDHYDHLHKMVWFKENSNPTDVAKELLQEAPGHRALFLWHEFRHVQSHNIWRDSKQKLVNSGPDTDSIYKEYKTRFSAIKEAAKGELDDGIDLLPCDFESFPLGWWSFTDDERVEFVEYIQDNDYLVKRFGDWIKEVPSSYFRGGTARPLIENWNRATQINYLGPAFDAISMAYAHVFNSSAPISNYEHYLHSTARDKNGHISGFWRPGTINSPCLYLVRGNWENVHNRNAPDKDQVMLDRINVHLRLDWTDTDGEVVPWIADAGYRSNKMNYEDDILLDVELWKRLHQNGVKRVLLWNTSSTKPLHGLTSTDYAAHKATLTAEMAKRFI